jgi:hypothetical protein
MPVCHGIVIANLYKRSARGNTQDPDRPLNFPALVLKEVNRWMVLVPPFHPPIPFQKTPVLTMLKHYMEKKIQRCLSNPAILVLALVYLSSAKRSKPAIPHWATQAL